MDGVCSGFARIRVAVEVIAMPAIGRPGQDFIKFFKGIASLARFRNLESLARKKRCPIPAAGRRIKAKARYVVSDAKVVTRFVADRRGAVKKQRGHDISHHERVLFFFFGDFLSQNRIRLSSILITDVRPYQHFVAELKDYVANALIPDSPGDIFIANKNY